MGFFRRFFGGRNGAGAESIIHHNIQEIGLNHFPDDENARWNIDSIEFVEGMYVVVTSPVPHVGYSKIRFHMRDTSIDGVEIADYWENGQWVTLFTS